MFQDSKELAPFAVDVAEGASFIVKDDVFTEVVLHELQVVFRCVEDVAIYDGGAITVVDCQLTGAVGAEGEFSELLDDLR